MDDQMIRAQTGVPGETGRYPRIVSAGMCVPETQISNDDLSKFVDTNDEWIRSRTGIQYRRVATVEQTSGLCAKAARQALEQAGVSPAEVDCIIVATISPDYTTPSTACLVQQAIGACNAFAFDISAACSGFVYALSIAEKMMAGGRYKKALVIGGEVLSKIVDWSDRRTCVLFGDGAGAALLALGDTPSFLGEDLHADGEKAMALTGGYLPLESPFGPPDTEKNKYLYMDGRAVFDFALKRVPESICAALDRAGLTVADVDLLIPHQANQRIMDAIAKKIKLPAEKLYSNIQYYSNTSAATIPIALAELWCSGRVKPGSGQNIVLTGFGGGLTWGTIVYKIN